MNEQCCKIMTQVLAESDKPFYYPVYIDKEHNLKSGALAVQIFRLTPSGKAIAQKGRKTIFLAFCPFCGKKLEGMDA